MPRNPIALVLVATAALLFTFALVGTALGQTVWSGFSHTFSKPALVDASLPEHQDRITENVWLTRSSNQGLFNAKSELGYAPGVSPTDTEWATNLITENVDKEIAATHWANLSFEPWIDAYGGPNSMMLPARVTSRNAVVHLITDNIYLDLRFTTWGGGGGAFAYERATGTIIPPLTNTGDYNQNGTVDAADYVLWRDTLDQTASPAGSGADGDNDGMIDTGDYDFWRARFGNVITGGSGAGLAAGAAVPEPSAMVVALLSAYCTWLFTSSKRRRNDQ